MKRNAIFMFALALAFVATLGCGKNKKPADLPPLNPTTVTVTYDDGTPVDEATVALIQSTKSGGRTWNLVGVTDATGSLIVKTDGTWDGAPEGEYNVMVTKEILESSDDGETPGKVKIYVDPKYGSASTSGLKATIVKGENNIELKVGEKMEKEGKAAAD